jgi:hypothetical protein
MNKLAGTLHIPRISSFKERTHPAAQQIWLDRITVTGPAVRRASRARGWDGFRCVRSCEDRSYSGAEQLEEPTRR